MMKKSTFGAVLAFLFVAAGALTAAALYLYRREKELDEYERLLFSDDYADDAEDEDEDMWDVVREMEMAQAAANAPSKDHSPPSRPLDTDAGSHSAGDGTSKEVSSTNHGPSNTEQDASQPGAAPPEEARATNDEGWDEMYL